MELKVAVASPCPQVVRTLVPPPWQASGMTAVEAQVERHPPAPAVVVAVQPELLGSVITRLLRARGWRVQQVRNHDDLPPAADAFVFNDGALEGPPPRAPITIELPDATGVGGQVSHNGQVRALAREFQGLEYILDLLGSPD
jgi:hypothetical protein